MSSRSVSEPICVVVPWIGNCIGITGIQRTPGKMLKFLNEPRCGFLGREAAHRDEANDDVSLARERDHQIDTGALDVGSCPDVSQ
jgi:hypothetical protein